MQDAYERFTSLDEVLDLQGNLKTVPYVICSYPLSVWSRSISTGTRYENVRGGSVEVLLVKYIGQPIEADPAEKKEFLELAGALFEEMDNARDEIISAAETTAGQYTFFDEFTTERDLERSPFAERSELDDYMHVGWRLSCNPAGGNA